MSVKRAVQSFFAVLYGGDKYQEWTVEDTAKVIMLICAQLFAVAFGIFLFMFASEMVKH